jgi:hypothetical protein
VAGDRSSGELPGHKVDGRRLQSVADEGGLLAAPHRSLWDSMRGLTPHC